MRSGPVISILLLAASALLVAQEVGASETVVLVPLDDRPACRRFPEQIGRIGGLSVVTPPRARLGGLSEPGDCDAVLEWLRAQAPRSQAVVVSLDMLATGGLVASRTPDVPEEEAVGRVSALREIKAGLGAGTPLYAFDTVQRIAPTTFDAASGEIALNIANYVRSAAQAEAECDDDLARRAEAARAQIPPDALEHYYAARRRNHAVNVQALRLVSEGVIDRLILALDDTAAYGPHVPELAAIRRSVDELGIADRVAIYPGADEVAMSLVACVAAELSRSGPAVKVLYFPRGAESEVQPYEERPLRESMGDQVRAIGGRLVPLRKDADLVLVVIARPTPGMAEDEHARQIRHAARAVEQHVGLGLPVSVADITRVNVADAGVVVALGERIALSRLAGYAAWGTPANAIGTALSHGALVAMGRELRGAERASAERAHLAFLFDRLIDDYGYLAVARPRVAEKLGVEGYSLKLGERWSEVEARVEGEMTALAPELYLEHFGSAAVNVYGARARLQLVGLRARLPWPRMFEVELETSFSTLPR